MRIIVHNYITSDGAADGLAERIAGAKALYLRPGTPGEREAAAAALRRMGIDPTTLATAGPSNSQPSQRPSRAGPRKYEVVLQYTWTNKHGVTQTQYTPKFVTEASDEIEAEAKARADMMYTWRKTVGGRPPEFRAYSTKRV